MFDVAVAERMRAAFEVDVPPLDFDWQVGLIVGPSGSGKTTIARALFGGLADPRPGWPREAAVVDGFGELPIREIVGLLTAVGFSSPPSWIKPYAVLSQGEQFRCDLARALSASFPGRRAGESAEAGSPPGSLVVFDEFTSVVDRQVARFGSAAIARAIRSGRIPCRFVAVTCHYDVAEWLEADWSIDMARREFQRRRLRRPPVRIEVYRCRAGAWRLFAPHHYLSGALNPAARCHLAAWQQTPVAFCATLPLRGRRRHRRITRLVTLPDFQGLGIGIRLAEAVAQSHRDEGDRVNITASHPAVLAHCRRSPRWRLVQVLRAGARPGWSDTRGSLGRAVVSFEYLGSDGPAES